MRTLAIVTGLGLSLFSIVACGGSHPEPASAATVASAEPETTGSIAPAPEKPAPPASETAKASTKEDGSDIIPPFSSGSGPAAASKKVVAKKGAKPKKKL